MDTKKEKNCRKNWIKRVAIGVVGVSGLVILTVTVLFRNELKTINHIKQMNDHPFYEMTYYADYGLGELEKQGVDSDDALVSFVSKQLLKGLPIEANVDGACSAFNVQSPENDFIMGRNFDYFPSTAMIVQTNPQDGYRSISMVNLTHIGYDNKNKPDSLLHKVKSLAAPYIPLDGMNEKGFAVGVLVVKEQVVHQNTGKIPITTTSAIRLLLDRAANVDEAIELLKIYDMNSSGETGYHFFLADASGKSAVVEYIENEMKVVRNTEQGDPLVVTNFTLSTTEQEGGGKDRYKIICNGVNQCNGIMGEESVMQLLSDAHFDGVKVSGGDKNHEYYNCTTQWSAVYNLTQKKVTICTGMDYDTKYEYSIE